MDTLARRFTIVCLVTALFGMGLADLVARNDNSYRGKSFDAGCKISQRFDC